MDVFYLELGICNMHKLGYNLKKHTAILIKALVRPKTSAYAEL